jgi:hypothetical protein
VYVTVILIRLMFIRNTVPVQKSSLGPVHMVPEYTLRKSSHSQGGYMDLISSYLHSPKVYVHSHKNRLIFSSLLPGNVVQRFVVSQKCTRGKDCVL